MNPSRPTTTPPIFTSTPLAPPVDTEGVGAVAVVNDGLVQLPPLVPALDVPKPTELVSTELVVESLSLPLVSTSELVVAVGDLVEIAVEVTDTVELPAPTLPLGTHLSCKFASVLHTSSTVQQSCPAQPQSVPLHCLLNR